MVLVGRLPNMRKKRVVKESKWIKELKKTKLQNVPKYRREKAILGFIGNSEKRQIRDLSRNPRRSLFAISCRI